MIRLDWDDSDDAMDRGSDDDVDSRFWRDALRGTLAEPYAKVSDGDLDRALDGVLTSMSEAEGFSLAGALNQIGRSAAQVVRDPDFQQGIRTALPIAGTAAGTALGGPVGAALGGQVATMAAGAVPARTRSAPVAQPPLTTRQTAAPTPSVASATGSAAATRALVLAQQPELLQGLLATALGPYGQRQVAGVPVAQMLGLLGELVNRAAADADELAYLSGDDGEDLEQDSSESYDDLYTRLLDIENERFNGLINDGRGQR